MPVHLTARGTALLVAGASLWVISRMLAIPELSIFAVTSVTLVASSLVSLSLATRAVSAQRSLATACLDHGDSRDVTLELRNDGLGATANITVEERCPHALLGPASGPLQLAVGSLGHGGTIALGYRIVGGARGRFTVGPLLVHARDPFGLARRSWHIAGTSTLLVYPPIETLPAGTVVGARPFEASDEFDAIREYVHGDDLRLIHWPSTAHRQRPMVRQRERARFADACVFLDTRDCAHAGSGESSTLEKAIGVAATFVTHLADRGFAVRLITEEDQRVRPVRDPTHLLVRLAELEPSPSAHLGTALDHAGRDGALMVAVVRPVPADVRALVRAGRGSTGRFAIVIADAPGDPRAQELAAALINAGWRAAPLAPGQPLASWPVLSPVEPSR